MENNNTVNRVLYCRKYFEIMNKNSLSIIIESKCVHRLLLDATTGNSRERKKAQQKSTV